MHRTPTTMRPMPAPMTLVGGVTEEDAGSGGSQGDATGGPDAVCDAECQAAVQGQDGRPADFDKTIYKRRNEAERTINALKGFRAVATRYDKRAPVFQGTVSVAAIRLLLRGGRSIIPFREGACHRSPE